MVFFNIQLRRLPPVRSVRSASRLGAFTLVELLVVLLIIGILAALLLSTVGVVRGRMDSVQCLSQLRQIGSGLGAYIGDHNGMMPGPLNFKQSAVYLPNQSGSLPALLESYLGTANSKAPDGVSRYSPLFVCPAAAKKLNDPARASYMVNMLPLPNVGQSPWGDIALSQEPLSKTALGNWWQADTSGASMSLAEVWAIQDADQSYVAQVTSVYNGSYSDLLPTQAHGDHWNDLFFDFHTASRTSLTEIISPTTSTPAPGGSAGSP